MKVAVVTPYCGEALDVLRTCHDSVRRQTHPCRHYMVADGRPEPGVAAWPVVHLHLPSQHHDGGNTARCIGAMAAAGDGVDAIAFLDADNWYHDDHVESLVDLHRRTGAAVCTSGRDIHRVDGSLLQPGGDAGDGDTHVDTSCFWFHRQAFEMLALWAAMPRPLGPICDRVVWAAVMARDIARAHSGRATLAYRTRYAAHYAGHREPLPAGAKAGDEMLQAFRFWEALPEAAKALLLRGPGAAPAQPPA